MVFEKFRSRFEVSPDLSFDGVTEEAILAFESAMEAAILPFVRTDGDRWKPDYDAIYDETCNILRHAGWRQHIVDDQKALESTSIITEMSLPVHAAHTYWLHRPMDIPVFQREYARRVQQKASEEYNETTDTRVREELWSHEACDESRVAIRYRDRKNRWVITFGVTLGFTGNFSNLAFEAFNLDVTKHRFRRRWRCVSSFDGDPKTFTCQGHVLKGFVKANRDQKLRAAISSLNMQRNFETMGILHLPVFLHSELRETNA